MTTRSENTPNLIRQTRSAFHARIRSKSRAILLSATLGCSLTTRAFGQSEPLDTPPDTSAPEPEPTTTPEPTPPAPAPQPALAPAPQPALAPAQSAPDPSTRRHDGFYLRWALGPGYMLDSIDSNQVGKAELRGFAIAGELLFGGTPAPGLVIGGGTQSATVPSPSLEIEGSSGEPPNLLTLSAFGAFVDYYFDPHGGWHAQAFAGLAILSADASKFDEDPAGFALAIGGGHDWWVSGQLGLGILARVLYAPLRFDRNDIEETHHVFVPGLLGTLTYH